MPPAAPAYCHPAAYEAFSRELPGADSPEGLLRAAAAISLNADPGGSIEGVVESCRRLSSEVQRRLLSDSQEAAAAHLHDVLFDLIGFRGAEAHDYWNPRNSYLPTVLERKRGIPITLTLVYRAVAAPLGLRVDGVNSPGHFLAALHCREASGVRLQYVDPFYGGGLLSRAEAIARVESIIGRPVAHRSEPLPIASATAWLRRMLLNLQAIFARTQQERELLAMQELESLLPPG